MREKKQGETILSLFFLGFFVMLTIISLTYSPKARRLPLIVGIPGVVLAAVEVYRRTIKRSTPEPQPAVSPDVKETEEEGQGLTDDPRKVAGMIGWVVLLVGMIWILGFLVTIPGLYLAFHEGEEGKLDGKSPLCRYRLCRPLRLIYCHPQYRTLSGSDFQTINEVSF